MYRSKQIGRRYSGLDAWDFLGLKTVRMQRRSEGQHLFVLAVPWGSAGRWVWFRFGCYPAVGSCCFVFFFFEYCSQVVAHDDQESR